MKRPRPRPVREPGDYLIKVRGELSRGWQRGRWNGREWSVTDRRGGPDHCTPSDVVAFGGAA